MESLGRPSIRYMLVSWDCGKRDDESHTGQANNVPSMDPFSKRLRKQRERSSLQARQLNKNALTMLKRQLNVLERHEMQNARALRRSRQAFLEELEASQDLDYEVLEPQTGKPAQPLQNSSLSPRAALPSWPAEDNAGLDRAGSGSTYTLPQCADNHGTSSARTAISSGSNSSFKGVSSRNSSSPSTPRDGPQEITLYRRQLAGGGSSDVRSRATHAQSGSDSRSSRPTSCEQLSCRFRALSPLSPCRYFPCSKPKHYHRLKVSDVDVPGDSIPFRASAGRTELGGGGGGGPVHTSSASSLSASSSFVTTSDNYNNNRNDNCQCHSTGGDAWNSSISLPSASSSSSAINGDAEGGNDTETSGSSNSSSGRSRFADAGVWTCRTSIKQRVRGLKQAAQGMREKNEAKKPRDWAVNYGDPVSRRLLRKPVLAVSEVVL